MPRVRTAGAELAPPALDTASTEFCSIIDDLEPDQQQQAVALLRLGRGVYDAEEWDEALAAARDDWNPATPDYLLGHALLTDGLVTLGYSVE